MVTNEKKPELLTWSQIMDEFKDVIYPKSIKDWAKETGHDLETVRSVTRGQNKGTYGKGKKVKKDILATLNTEKVAA